MMRWLGGLLLFAAVYGLSARLGLAYSTIAPNSTLLWPPTGISLFVVMRFGYHWWPGIVLGDLLANWDTGASVPAILGIASGNVLQTLICAWLLVRVAGFHDALDRIRDVVSLLILGTLCAGISATLGPGSLALDGRIDWQMYPTVWLQWLMGDATGVLVLTPALLAWTVRPRPGELKGSGEGVALLLLLLAANEAVFGGLGIAPTGYYPAALALFPLLVWGALRFGMRGATAVTFIIAMAAIRGTSLGRGPFDVGDSVDNLVHWWVFANVIALTSLVLAASRAERLRAQQALERERDFVSTVLDAENALVAVINAGGRIVRSNRALQALAGSEPGEVLGRSLAEDLTEPRHREKVKGNLEMLRRRVSENVSFQAALRRKVGRPRVVAWSVTTLDESAGHAGYAIATGIDITEQTEATDALRAARRDLARRVAERTRELERANEELKAEASERHRLQAEIIRVSEHEQMRIGRELHDGLGQHLTATAFQAELLERRLREAAREEADDAASIGRRIAEAVSHTRLLARGLHPVELEAGGLMSALELLAANARAMFRIDCRFLCPRPVPVDDSSLAINLYRIAQEAVTNAAKHSGAKCVEISLEPEGPEGICLRIADDGRGLGGAERCSGEGLGLRIMQHRSRMIGAALDLDHPPRGGLQVTVRTSAGADHGRAGRE